MLVTGGAGFIGSALVRKLLDKGYEVTVLDDLSTGLQDNLPKSNHLGFIAGDVRDFELVSTVIRDHQYVIHLAAQAFIPLCYQRPLEIAEVNSIGSINIFKACLDHAVKRLVHISSSEVYGSAKYTPMDEQHPLCPYSTYSVAKAAADMWAQTFYWEHKRPVVILRPFNTYGPRESLPYFIPEMIRQCLKESINIGSGETRKMKDILKLIQQETDAEKKQVVLDKSRLRPRDLEMLVTDNAKARKILGWAPRIGFEEGIRRTLKWYINHGQTWGYEKYGWKWRY